jgi:hypothetical protein
MRELVANLFTTNQRLSRVVVGSGSFNKHTERASSKGSDRQRRSAPPSERLLCMASEFADCVDRVRSG